MVICAVMYVNLRAEIKPYLELKKGKYIISRKQDFESSERFLQNILKSYLHTPSKGVSETLFHAKLLKNVYRIPSLKCDSPGDISCFQKLLLGKILNYNTGKRYLTFMINCWKKNNRSCLKQGFQYT